MATESLKEALTRVFALAPAGLAYDSRRVQPGFVFFAIKGFRQDGHDFVGDAIRRGAVGVVVEKEVAVPPGVVAVCVPDTRRALALAAAAFYGHPDRQLRLVGVTGTNGKTTTTHLIRAIYEAQGEKTGLIGTLWAMIGDAVLPAERTTPESLDLQALLRRMVDEGVKTVVMEVSSHALALERVAGIEYDIAVFTNLTQDHLDFHRDMEDYYAAKARLFLELKQPGVKGRPKRAVLNVDDPYGQRLAAASGGKVVTYGVEREAAFRAREIELGRDGTTFTVEWAGGAVPVRLQLVGRFNVYNALAAFAVGVTEGYPVARVVEALEGVPAVPGRFERVDVGQDFAVVVDYAHTPDGLENVLRAARAQTRGRVIVVFGCGGDRDPGKRPLMGEIAAKLADFTVITSDNPRSEDPQRIIAAIERGFRRCGAPGSYAVEADRRAAIALALGQAQAGDIVVLAGKGHEDYQIIGDKKLPFDDRKVAAEILKEMIGERDGE